MFGVVEAAQRHRGKSPATFGDQAHLLQKILADTVAKPSLGATTGPGLVAVAGLDLGLYLERALLLLLLLMLVLMPMLVLVQVLTADALGYWKCVAEEIH